MVRDTVVFPDRSHVLSTLVSECDLWTEDEVLYAMLEEWEDWGMREEGV